MSPRTFACRLTSDQRGAAMLMGVFFATFLVGVISYVMGVGDAIVHRERMQDAADAGAFAAAVMHARGMNIIALINIVMSALLSVLVLLRLMEGLLTIAIAGLTVASFFTAGATASLIPPLVRGRNLVQQIQSRAKPIVYRGLTALHWVSKGMRVLMPGAAQMRVVDTVRAEYGDVAIFGFALPMSFTLPVTPDTFDVLCGKAGGVVGSLALLPVSGIIPDRVEGMVEGAAESLAQSLSGYFCGDGSADPPTFEPPEKNVQYPRLASSLGCERSQTEGEAHTNCRNAAMHEAQGMPDGFDREAPVGTGDCRLGTITYHEPSDGAAPDALGPQATTSADCGRYQEWVEAAASQCNPHDESNPHHDDLEAFVWQQVTRVETYQLVNESGTLEWKQVQTAPGRMVVYENPHIERDDDPPACDADEWPEGDDMCRPDLGPFVPREEYRCTAITTSDGQPFDCPPQRSWPMPTENIVVGSKYELRYAMVREILGCQAQIRMPVTTLDMETTGGVQNKETKSPFKLEDDALLGEDVFQLRVLVFGKTVSNETLEGVKVALYSETDTTAQVLEQLRHVGRFTVAQAEYFTTEANGENQTDENTRREWMWTPKWRARLRRIWIPTEFNRSSPTQEDAAMLNNPNPATTIEDACQNAQASEGGGAGADCSGGGGETGGGGLSGAVQKLSEIFIH